MPDEQLAPAGATLEPEHDVDVDVQPHVAEPGDLAQLLRGQLSEEEHAARVEAVRRRLDDEERALQAAVVRQIPAAARPLAVLNRSQGFRHPLVTMIARRERFAALVRPLIRLRDRGRARRSRRATLRRAPARSPGRPDDDEPEPLVALEAAA